MDQHHHQQQELCVPPGFRFHPTEDELVEYYLARKVASQKIDLDIIQEVDLYRIEPWDLQERCGRGGGAQAVDGDMSSSSSSEWYFFSFKDRKYPSGTRTNRATAAGFWKATGRDKPVLSSRPSRGVIGMRKTLVFYKGRAPNGRKTDWIIHEYRIQSNEHAPTQEEGWVVCRAFQKPVPNQRSFVFPSYATAPGYYDDLRPHLHDQAGDLRYLHPAAARVSGFTFPAGQGEDFESKKNLFDNIPHLTESPPTTTTVCGDDIAQHGHVAAAIDWNFLDSLLSTSLLRDSSSASAASQMYLQ
ncbi:hypothetical protein ACQ4PT_040475 [Festuca glaucescens]